MSQLDQARDAHSNTQTTETAALVAAIDARAREIRAGVGDPDDLQDATYLVRALARIVAGQSIRAAFGSPGDWGYDTPIGKALAGLYRPPCAQHERHIEYSPIPGRGIAALLDPAPAQPVAKVSYEEAAQRNRSGMGVGA